MPNAEYFWSKVDASGDCWLWTGTTNWGGYGSYDRRGAHRVAYELLVGPIPDGLQIDHLCRVRNCVNPDHLEPVTGRENSMRSPATLIARNSAKTLCPKGHPYVQRALQRVCRTCENERGRVLAVWPRTHCKRGHEFTPENIYVRPSVPNKRLCRICLGVANRENQRRIRDRAACDRRQRQRLEGGDR